MSGRPLTQAELEQAAAFERMVLYGRSPLDDLRDAAIRACGVRALGFAAFRASRGVRAVNESQLTFAFHGGITRG